MIGISISISIIIFMIRIEVYDWDADGGHDFIGDCTTTLEELAQGEGFQIIQVRIIIMIIKISNPPIAAKIINSNIIS